MAEYFEKPADYEGWERVCLTVDGCLLSDDDDRCFASVMDLLSRAVLALQQWTADRTAEALKLQQKEQSLEERKQWQQQQIEPVGNNPLPIACLVQVLDLKIRNVSCCRTKGLIIIM
jgi:hypothetical protein